MSRHASMYTSPPPRQRKMRTRCFQWSLSNQAPQVPVLILTRSAAWPGGDDGMTMEDEVGSIR